MNDDVDRVVLIVSLLEILDESIVRLEARLLRLLPIQGNDITFD